MNQNDIKLFIINNAALQSELEGAYESIGGAASRPKSRVRIDI